MRYLEEKNKIETWFDAETELLNYALEITEGTYRSPQADDREGHRYFQTMLKEYLTTEQENFRLNNKSMAVSLMKAVTENGFFDEVYTFNYTDVNRVLAKAGRYAPMKIKMALTGTGSASKEQVAGMLQRILKLDAEQMKQHFDATDALAAAYCHFMQSNRPESTAHYRSWKDFVNKNKEKTHSFSPSKGEGKS